MYDLILAGGQVFDGKGSAPYKANVCIRDGKIVRITPEEMPAKQVLDVSGLAVAPGFIDIHSHSDTNPIVKHDALSHIAQGVTLQIAGNCGTSIMPTLTPQADEELDSHVRAKKGMSPFCSITDWAAAVTDAQPLGNYGTLIGHSNLRLAVMGFVYRDPTAEEMEQLKELLDREMSRGAFGMSLGLIYPPSAFSGKEELTELAKVVAKHDGILSVHMRNEGPRIFQAVQEMIDVARDSGVHLQISHLKLMGKPQWGKTAQLLGMLQDARAQGVNITCDQYPFMASSTNLSALVPHWAHDGGRPALLERVEKREGTLCDEIAQEMENRGGPEAVLVVSTGGKQPQWQGKTIAQLSQEFGISPVETVRKVLLESGTVSCAYFSMQEADVLKIMEQKFICVGSDGSDFHHDHEKTPHVPHPRNFSTFPRFFQCVRENSLMPLEDAVYKATGLTASILGITDRGVLAEGKVADITVFDPKTIGSDATFLESRVLPKGIPYVIVDGQVVMADGKPTGARPGRGIVKEKHPL